MQTDFFPSSRKADAGDRQTRGILNSCDPACTDERQSELVPKAQIHSAGQASPAAVLNVLIETAGRLEQLLIEETAMLSKHSVIAFDDFNRKKSQGLLELRRAIDAARGLPCLGSGLDPKPAFAQLRRRLQENLSVLRTHLDAAKAVAAIITRSIQEHESDGTYTPAAFHKEKSL
jgi:hypothetical protein